MMKFMCIVAMFITVMDVTNDIYKPHGLLLEAVGHNAYMVISWLSLAGWAGSLFCLFSMKVVPSN